VAPLILFPGSLFLGRIKWAVKFPRVPLVWFGVTFALLTLTVSKQNHYALLLLPPGAWLLSGLIPAGFKLHRWALCFVLLTLAVETARFAFDEEVSHQRFLREAAPRVAEAKTLHVVGINSAVFDFQLGRHVHNTDRFQEAYRRAHPGDAVLVIQKRDRIDETPEDSSVLDHSDAEWIRRVYFRQVP